MMTTTPKDAAERLAEIKEEMEMLLTEAQDLLRELDNEEIANRAESYWYAHITMALSDEHMYLGKHDGTLQGTIDEINALDEE